jgi:hypothetical protein
VLPSLFRTRICEVAIDAPLGTGGPRQKIHGDIDMQRAIYVLAFATSLSLSLASYQATAASLTREQVRADLIAAEMSGKFPQNKANRPDPAMSYAARKAAQKVEKPRSDVLPKEEAMVAPVAPALNAEPRSEDLPGETVACTNTGAVR